MAATLLILAAAMAADALVGEPPGLWRRVPHPVVVMGRAIAFLDRQLNRDIDPAPRRRAAGIAALGLLLTGAVSVGLALSIAARALPYGWAVEILVVAVFLAQRSLDDHVAAVARAFSVGGIGAARAAVSRIVGRDPQSLDEAAICRAAIESNAENYSDGVLAPAFWYLVGGLPGLIAYKMVNTADSMIGHRSARHADFGWAAARLDDLLNLVPARLCGLLMALAAPVVGGRPWSALRIMLRDAPHHRSPNAGWPEAATAAALGVALAGPRRYGGVVVDDHWMGDGGRAAATPGDIRRALRLTRALGLMLFTLTLGAGLLIAG